MLFPQLVSRKMKILEDLKNISEQIKIFKGIKKNQMIYSEYHSILVAQSGVSSQLKSYKPALLKCVDWSYSTDNFIITFEIIASQDPTPYQPNYQSEYSGKQAIIHAPVLTNQATEAYKKIKIISKEDLPLFINYEYKTKLYSNLFK